jgi:transcription elongation factor GreA
MTDESQATSGSAEAPALPTTLTREGYDRLQQGVTLLRDQRRPALVQQLQRATLFMDPAAGAGIAASVRYDLDALDKQIAGLEDTIRRAHVVDPDPDKKTVQLGSQVTVRYEDGTEETLTVVGPLEADPGRGLISNASPVGRALLGKDAGANVTLGDGADALAIAVVAIGKPTAFLEPAAGLEA